MRRVLDGPAAGRPLKRSPAEIPASLAGTLCQTQLLIDPFNPAAKPTQTLSLLIGPDLGGDTSRPPVK
jgi:hypothetical protein